MKQASIAAQAESVYLTEFDLHLLAEGTHYRSYEKLGAHITEKDGKRGVYFAVWAPNAERVCAIGEFNNWNEAANPMQLRPEAGIWDCFIAGVEQGARYKYQVISRFSGYKADKADPFGFAAEIRPETASRVWDLED